MAFTHSLSVAESAGSSVRTTSQTRPASRKSLRWDPSSTRTVLLLVLTTAYLFPLTRLLYSNGDDGTLIYGALRVSKGEIPGRDFLEVMGPGSFYWLGSFFKIFGTGWQVTRVYLLATGVATSVLLYAIARQVCRESAAVLLWLFTLVMGMALWPAVSHHWDSNLFAILALWCYLKLEKTGNPFWAAAAGCLAGLTTCFIQPKGLFLLLGFAASAVLRRVWLRTEARWGALWFLFGGYAAVGIAVLGAFWRAGALRNLIYANVVWPMSTYDTINVVPYGYGMLKFALGPSLQLFGANRPIPGLIFAGLSYIPFLLIAALPLISAGPVFASLFSRERLKRWNPCLAVTLAGAALWLSEIHRRDVVHLAAGAPVLLIALFASLQLISRSRIRNAVTGAIAASLMVFGILNFVAHVQGSHAVETRRGTVMTAADDQALQFLNSSVKAGEFVFVYPYSPIYYYLADVRNPTRLSTLLYGYNPPAQFDEVVYDLEEKRVPYVLDSGASETTVAKWFPGYRRPAADKLVLEHYLRERYQPIAIKDGFRVLRRRSDD
jgi:Dolichyl-phosphate-mannose-protein mannosyltransferase